MWSHKEHGKGWVGSYERTAKTGERVLLLSKEGRKPKQFGSHQQAKAMGWTLS